MAHSNTIVYQLLKLVPGHQFDTLAKRHHSGRRFRVASRWSQFVALAMAQFSGRASLRDIVDNLTAQTRRLYHLGSIPLTRSTLARINKEKSYRLYKELAQVLMAKCQESAPKHRIPIKSALYSLDSTTIDLCLSAFPWAQFRRSKGAIKIHVGLNHNGYMPEFVCVTKGKTADISVGRTFNFPKGSVVVFDRGYIDYTWYKHLHDQGVFFVTRIKVNTKHRVVERRDVDKEQGVYADQSIRLTGTRTAEKYPFPLRRIVYRDAQTGKRYVYITNNFKMSARTIADIYKARWQVELFFKLIKQHLKIKSFVGTSRNAVLTQIWVALCVYLLLALVKFRSQLGRSIGQMLRLLQLNLFERRDLMALMWGDPPLMPDPHANQLALL